MHFFTYDREFITQYCQVSALLELESLLSQQSLREAFSDSELSTAKQRHQQVQEYIQVPEQRARLGVGRGWDRDVLGGLQDHPLADCVLRCPRDMAVSGLGLASSSCSSCAQVLVRELDASTGPLRKSVWG